MFEIEEIVKVPLENETIERGVPKNEAFEKEVFSGHCKLRCDTFASMFFRFRFLTLTIQVYS